MMTKGTVFLLVFKLVVVADSAAPHLPVYPIPGSHHCYSCPNGTKVSNDCVVDWTDSSCEPCDTHHFQDEPNMYKYCKMCNTYCPKNGVVLQNCTALTDMICLCPAGYHRFPIDHIDPNFDCRLHRDCRPGEGEVHSGNFTHDRKCRMCEKGREFVNVTTPEHPVCSNCTKCQTTVIQQCTLLTDSTCADNSSINDVINTSVIPHAAEKQDTGDSRGFYAFIWVVPFGLGVIALVIIVMRKGGFRKQFRELTGWKIVWIIFFILFGIVTVIAWLIYTVRCSDHDIRQDPLAVIEMLPKTANGDTLNQPSEVANGDPQNRPAGSADGDQVNQTSSSALNAQSDPKEWSTEFITRDVFRFISGKLGLGWEGFIRVLPWPKDVAVSAKIYQAQESNRSNVAEQIHTALELWYRVSPKEVTRACILATLGKHGRNDMVEELEEMA